MPDLLKLIVCSQTDVNALMFLFKVYAFVIKTGRISHVICSWHFGIFPICPLIFSLKWCIINLETKRRSIIEKYYSIEIVNSDCICAQKLFSFFDVRRLYTCFACVHHRCNDQVTTRLFSYHFFTRGRKTLWVKRQKQFP